MDKFYQNISISKFTICPRGCGIDTYRLWESLYLGSIPIIQRYDGHKEFEDLPILFLDSIDEYKNLTSEYLETVYIEMLNKNYNYDKLSLSYWMNRIKALEALLVKRYKDY
jgi:hypothetical protein